MTSVLAQVAWIFAPAPGEICNSGFARIRSR